ncbi:MAG: hypothetical protein ACOCV1_05085 [Bacillota bacterium]
MIKVWRIKHKPTGLYWCPVRWILSDKTDKYGKKHYVKSNLSLKGKMYFKQPTIDMLGKYYKSHLDPLEFSVIGSKLILKKHEIKKTEWEIEEK